MIDPSWTCRAEWKPPRDPRRMVSIVTAPGGALNEIAIRAPANMVDSTATARLEAHNTHCAGSSKRPSQIVFDLAAKNDTDGKASITAATGAVNVKLLHALGACRREIEKPLFSGISRIR
jgi:hypothetical protein